MKNDQSAGHQMHKIWKTLISRRTFIKGAVIVTLGIIAEQLGLFKLLRLSIPQRKTPVPKEVSMDHKYPNANVKRRVVEKAKEVLMKNLKTGTRIIGGQEYDYLYICPAIEKYPHQWLWDSSFHAIVTSEFNPDLAKREIESLFKGMQPNGFMPNMILWDRVHTLAERLATKLFFTGITSNLTQPPVIAISLEELYKNTYNLDFIRRYLPLVKKYFSWLEAERDPDGDGLVSVIHPWETGIDASPVFDSLLGINEIKPRPLRVYQALYGLLLKYAMLGWNEEKIFAAKAFNVEYVMFNCIYAQGLRAIASLSKIIGNHKDSALYNEKADKVEKAILDICWNEEKRIFFDISSPDNRQLQVKTISSLFPIILDSIPRDILDELVTSHLLNEREFWLPFPVPSVSKDEPTFNPNDNLILWRGPTWINTNWFLVRGLKKHGYDEVASQIAKRLIALVDQAGFWEFYNPFTGEGGGQKDYSWSTLVVDMFDYIL
jgi:glycogen debranching enzyme